MKSTTRFWSGIYFIDLRHFIEISLLCYRAIQSWTGSLVPSEDSLVFLSLMKDQQRLDKKIFRKPFLFFISRMLISVKLMVTVFSQFRQIMYSVEMFNLRLERSRISRLIVTILHPRYKLQTQYLHKYRHNKKLRRRRGEADGYMLRFGHHNVLYISEPFS